MYSSNILVTRTESCNTSFAVSNNLNIDLNSFYGSCNSDLYEAPKTEAYYVTIPHDRYPEDLQGTIEMPERKNGNETCCCLFRGISCSTVLAVMGYFVFRHQ
ncbi:MAG: hypothetical protein WCJ33_03410 [Pseudomonadota bacterium]